jgi:hypothetical protein
LPTSQEVLAGLRHYDGAPASYTGHQSRRFSLAENCAGMSVFPNGRRPSTLITITYVPVVVRAFGRGRHQALMYCQGNIAEIVRVTLLEADSHSSRSRIVANGSHCVGTHGDHFHDISPSDRSSTDTSRAKRICSPVPKKSPGTLGTFTAHGVGNPRDLDSDSSLSLLKFRR